MTNHSKAIVVVFLIIVIISITFCGTKEQSLNKNLGSQILNIQIILGSTRDGRTSDKIGAAFKKIADKKANVTTEIVDLKDYNLPFLSDAVAPASRKVINDPTIKKWSDKINQADAFIIVMPEYNSGYPGVLKNALDSLYPEWNNKPVAFVGYSGGPSGGTSAVEQLRKVTIAFGMIPVKSEINIPSSWKALNEKGEFVDRDIEQKIYTIIDQIIAAKK